MQWKEERDPLRPSDDKSARWHLDPDDGPTVTLVGDLRGYDPARDNVMGRALSDGYVIGRCIGIGGMGAVYEAENTTLGRRLAVKVLHPAMSTCPRMTARFLAEAHAASAIKHENIIEIVDASHLADGRAYILMKYLEGETLRDHLTRLTRLSPESVLEIIVQACSGLEVAHARGIVHRDLKPANLFVTKSRRRPLLVTILDFGIAKLMGENELGHGNVVLGTPNYMSPEQARALTNVDHRTDVYALGVITFELLAGQLPYKVQSVDQLVRRLTQSGVPSVCDLRTDISPEWSAIVTRAMSLDPSERFQTVGEMAEAMVCATPRGDEIMRRFAPLD